MERPKRLSLPPKSLKKSNRSIEKNDVIFRASERSANSNYDKTPKEVFNIDLFVEEMKKLTQKDPEKAVSLAKMLFWELEGQSKEAKLKSLCGEIDEKEQQKEFMLDELSETQVSLEKAEMRIKALEKQFA